MAVVTGLTAARMLAIEAASIVDGDIVGENLILKRQDNTTIDAGVVRGAQGPTGPAGLALTVIPTKDVFDVGMVNQVRAGRKLIVADFTTLCSLPTTPIGLFGLGDLTNLGTGPALINKGAVTFGSDIVGEAAKAAQFSGSTAQALYIADTGAGDPFRIKMGSWGGWFKGGKRGVTQHIISKFGATQASRVFAMYVHTTNVLGMSWGDGTNDYNSLGFSDINDNRWHFGIATFDGSVSRLYIDGILEVVGYQSGVINSGSSPFNIGGRLADGATAAVEPYFGSIDEAFITPDVLTEDQIRLLYCSKIAHGFTVIPKQVILSVRRRRKGALLVSADFPSAPARLHNLDGLADLGSNNVPLTANPGTGAIVQVPGPEGAKDTARAYSGVHTGDSSTDAGLPAALTSRSYGIWFKVFGLGAPSLIIIGWGTLGSGDARMSVNSGGVESLNGTSTSGGLVPGTIDGNWHQATTVEDNGALDGIKRKVYIDGKFVGGATTMNNIILAGANRFRIGANPDGSAPFVGQLARAFVHPGALTSEEIRKLYLKGAQALGVSPKNVSDHIETYDATNIYATFDTLEGQNQIDLAVAV